MVSHPDDAAGLIELAEQGRLDTLRERADDELGLPKWRGLVLFDPAEPFGRLYGVRSPRLLTGTYLLINRETNTPALQALHSQSLPSTGEAFTLACGNQTKRKERDKTGSSTPRVAQHYFNFAGSPTLRATAWQRFETIGRNMGPEAAPAVLILTVKPRSERVPPMA